MKIKFLFLETAPATNSSKRDDLVCEILFKSFCGHYKLFEDASLGNVVFSHLFVSFHLSSLFIIIIFVI